MRLAKPAPPTWDSIAYSKEPKESAGPGSEILTSEDLANPFVRSTLPKPKKTSASLPESNSATSDSIGRPPRVAFAEPPTYKPPVFKPPVYTPPMYKSPGIRERPDDEIEKNKAPMKKRKIRTWVDDVEPFPFGEVVPVDSEKHKELLSKLAQLTGSEDFPGCEVCCTNITDLNHLNNIFFLL